MNSMQGKLEVLVERLVGILDEDILQLEMTQSRLDELRRAVIKRDQDELSILLEVIREQKERYQGVERRREEVRMEISLLLGCEAEEVNLSAVCANLAGEKRELVSEKQSQLKELAAKVKAEHKATMLLLKECTRINNSMLSSMFGKSKQAVTYDSRGKSNWDVQKRLVSFRL